MNAQNGARGHVQIEASMASGEHMDRLLTAEDVAEGLGMSPRWVLAEARAGRLRAVRLGRAVRFREATVAQWIVDLEAGRK